MAPRESFSVTSPGSRGRIPPYSEEAERGVLGSVLHYDGGARILDAAVEAGLIPESFHVVAHSQLFEALRKMQELGKPVNLQGAREYLASTGRLEQVGGGAFLDRLVDSTPTTEHANYFIAMVGQKHLVRQLLDQARKTIEDCYEFEGDATELLGRAEEAFLSISEKQRQESIDWRKCIEAANGTIAEILDHRKELNLGLSTGFADIDKKLLALKRKELIILAARPSMGKTSLAMNIAENVAIKKDGTAGEPVAVFSLEMSAEALAMRMLCSRGGVSFHTISSERGRFVAAPQKVQLQQAAAILGRAPLYVDDTAGLEISELRSRARRLKKRHGVKLVVVDYLQLMHCSSCAKEGRQRETSAISSGLKAMAKELDVPVIVLSQLSRNPEMRSDKSAKPRLSDLRDSGAIEQDADVVMLLRRPTKYKEDEKSDDERLAIVDIAKNRNGPTGEVELNFDAGITRFCDRIPDFRGEDASGPVVQGELSG